MGPAVEARSSSKELCFQSQASRLGQRTCSKKKRHHCGQTSLPVHDEAHNVLLGHVGELLGEDVFETNQPAD